MAMPKPRHFRVPSMNGTKTSEFTECVQNLEQQLTEAVAANSSLNPLVELLDLACNAEDPQETSRAIYALYRIFLILIVNGRLMINGTCDVNIVRAWIWDRLHVYVDFLASLLADEEDILGISALQILFSLLKHLSASACKTSAPSHPKFHVSIFKKIASGLLICPASKRPSPNGLGSGHDHGRVNSNVRDFFTENWFVVFDDIRWFFLREAALLLADTGKINHRLPANLLSILEQLKTFPTNSSELNTWWVAELGRKPLAPSKKLSSDAETGDCSTDDEDTGDWRRFFENDREQSIPADQKISTARLHKLTVHQSLHSVASHRAVFSRVWLSLLPQLSIVDDSSRTLSIRVLAAMHKSVIPHLTRPVLLMDWVGACVDFGDTVGLLGLNALFVLMKEYNLDYPSFYLRLYAFLDREVLHRRHRARFFRMMELFLNSTHLPAGLLASFIKRLARLSLSSSPSAIIMIIPFTYNVLKRHPALMVMIHNLDQSNNSRNDCFSPYEPDPNLTCALESSLWEIYSHKMHYHSGVSTLAHIFEEAFTKPGYPQEDFLDHTYSTLFDAEAQRKFNKEPATATQLERNLFPIQTLLEEIMGDPVTEFWSFG